MADLSNRLPVLAAEIKNANVVFASAQRLSADAIVVMGKSLVEAKELCPHGEWEAFLEKTGVPLRTAQRCMRIVKSGIGSDYLACVGMTTALQEIDKAIAAMPPDGQATMLTYENEDEEGPPNTLIWWRTGKLTGGFLQVWRAWDDDHFKMMIVERDYPAFFIAFIAEVADRGVSDLNPLRSREISRTTISLAVRDAKVAALRKAAREYAEEHP